MDKLIAKAMRGMKIMIAIKGMDMPANCAECPLTYPVGFYRNQPFFVDKSKGCCILACEIENPNIRLIDCPLIEIKECKEQ
jgi:hypothetical protein